MSFSLGQGLTRVVSKVRVQKGRMFFTYFDTPGLDDAEGRIETAKAVPQHPQTPSIILMNCTSFSYFSAI